MTANLTVILGRFSCFLWIPFLFFLLFVNINVFYIISCKSLKNLQDFMKILSGVGVEKQGSN